MRSLILKSLFIVLISETILFAQTKATPLPMVQAATTDTTTQLAIVVPKDSSYQYNLVDLENNLSNLPTSVEHKSRVYSDQGVDQVIFQNLSLKHSYQLQVRDSSKALVDQRRLHTLDLQLNPVRIAHISCQADYSILTKKNEMWNSVFAAKPDVLFFTGDNVYASPVKPVDPETIWRRYVETWSHLPVYTREELIPIFATWDDHDFGANNGDSSYRFISESKAIFEDFFPQKKLDSFLTKGPGVSQSFSAFGQHFIFMDDRSFRSPKGGVTQWGTEQEFWLTNQLNEYHDFTWIINGSQVFGKYGASEAYEKDQPESFQAFLNRLKGILTPVLFASGDLHASEIIRIPASMFGRESLEVTSSSIHSTHNPFKKILKDNPRRVAGFDGDNFVLVASEIHGNQLHLDLTSYGPNQLVLFKYSYDMKK